MTPEEAIKKMAGSKQEMEEARRNLKPKPSSNEEDEAIKVLEEHIKKAKQRSKKATRKTTPWETVTSDPIKENNHERDFFFVIMLFVVAQALSLVLYIWRLSVAEKENYTTGYQDGVMYQREHGQ